MSKQSASNAVSDRAEYVVVLRTRSADRSLPKEGYEWVLNVSPLDLPGVQVRTSTRRVDESGAELPPKLIIEVRGQTMSSGTWFQTGSAEAGSAEGVLPLHQARSAA